MPVIHKSTIKRTRQAEKRRQRNRTVLSRVKSVVKKVGKAVDQKDLELAKTSLREAKSELSKAATKGTLKRNTVSRRISRLTVRVNKLGSSPR